MILKKQLNSPVTELVLTLLFSPCVWIFEKKAKEKEERKAACVEQNICRIFSKKVLNVVLLCCCAQSSLRLFLVSPIERQRVSMGKGKTMVELCSVAMALRV